jgi:multimeric flavodoxin WrbA
MGKIFCDSLPHYFPKEKSFFIWEKILFAYDELHEVQNKILEKIREIASLLGAEVEIFHVEDKVKKPEGSENNRSEKTQIAEGLKGINHYYKNVESSAVIKEIEKEVKQINADLLIMMPKQYGFWDSLIHRSKTRIMASNNEVPLLSFPL